MRRTAIAAVVTGSAAGLVALAVGLRSGDRSREAPPGARDERAELVRAPAEPAPLAPIAPFAHARSPAQPEAAVAARAEGRAGLDSLESVASGPTELVVLVRVASGAPAAGAEVFLVDDGIPREPRERVPFEPIDRELEALGEQRIADARGAATFPPLSQGSGSVRVAARTERAFALAQLAQPRHGPFVLTLGDDPPIRVRVRDASEAPVADVPVGLAFPYGDVVRARTDGEGIAVLHAREHRRRADPAAVTLALPLPKRVVAPVDLDRVPREPIELRLPATGAIDVELVDARGAPWTGRARVVVEFAGIEMSSHPFVSATHAAIDGRARIEPLGLGLDLRLIVHADEHQDVRELVRGPDRPGECVELRVPVGRSLPVIAGRVLDGYGSPLAGASLRLELRDGELALGSSAAADLAGRFRAALAPSLLGWDAELIVEARCPDGGVLHGGGLRVTKKPGVSDLGDLVLSPAPLLLRGTVREREGPPIPGARLVLTPDPDPAQPWGGTPLPRGLSTDGEGVFERHAVLDATMLGVEVHADGFAAPPRLIVPVGTEGLELVLERAGAIRIRYTGVLGAWPSAWLERDGEPVARTRWTQSGDFQEFTGLLPGSYSVALGMHWSESRTRFDGVVVRAGETTRDPRLDPVDVETLLPRVALAVVDADGTPVASPSFSVAHPVSGDTFEVPARDEGSGAWLLALDLPSLVRVEAPGFRALDVEVDGDRRIVLARGIPVRIELDGALPPLPPGWAVLGELEHSSTRAETRFALDGGVAELLVSEPGTYAFAIRIRPAGPHAPVPAYWNDPRPVLDVRDDGTLQRFELAAPDASTCAAIEAFVEQER